jgi:hypothetical protein
MQHADKHAGFAIWTPADQSTALKQEADYVFSLELSFQ